MRDDISNNELQQLIDVLPLSENRELFMDIMEIDDLIDRRELKQIDVEEWFANTTEKLNQKKSKLRIFSFRLLKYAAIILILLGLIIFFSLEATQNGNEIKSIEKLVTLELGNGEVEVISDLDDKIIKNKDGRIIGTSKGNRLNYAKLAPTTKMAFNKLTVPFGKTFRVVLTDGTLIHLNSGSSLKYPVNFIKDSNREVFLSGEGYFEVAEDSANPFIVRTGGLDITVLGTQFDVSAYPEDSTISAVLIEGSIALSFTGERKIGVAPSILTPSYKATWIKGNPDISRETVDPKNYIGWLNGKIICNHMAFKDILKILERHYNVSIVSNNLLLNNKVFTATFDTETIEQVMASFQKNYNFKYSINNNNIIIE